MERYDSLAAIMSIDMPRSIYISCLIYLPFKSNDDFLHLIALLCETFLDQSLQQPSTS